MPFDLISEHSDNYANPDNDPYHESELEDEDYDEDEPDFNDVA